MLVNKGATAGSTVHIVPVEGGNWGVVDLKRHLFTAPSRRAAVERAKSVAVANQPSQVVLLDRLGTLIPIAHYQLPRYPAPEFSNGGKASLFEAAVKALLIKDLLAAGVPVLDNLVQKVNCQLENATSRQTRRRKQRPLAHQKR